MMDRRDFMALGLVGGAQVSGLLATESWALSHEAAQASVRDRFPRLRDQRFLNGAGGTPMGDFAADGARRFMEFWQKGPGGPEAAYFSEVMSEIKILFGDLVGAEPGEIALVNNTKAGEQLILDRLVGLPEGNIVTDDLHFAGSLHNYEGLRRAGWDVRVARAVDWQVRSEVIATLVDDDTRLIAVSHVSNINGHVADLRALADIAHAHGALLYADIIQSAGIVPLDLSASGVDFAACNGYKWLYGTHGSGFLYVRSNRQGSALVDNTFPGRAQLRYEPWTDAAEPGETPIRISLPQDASRYEPGHPSYIGYAALYEGLKFVTSIGVEALQAHSVALNARLLESVDPDRYPSISHHADIAPIVTFRVPHAPRLEEPLATAGVVVGLSESRVRVSPAIYNTNEDVDRLAAALNSA